MLVQIASGSYDIGGPGYASVTIVDNDIPPTVFIGSPGARAWSSRRATASSSSPKPATTARRSRLSYAWTQVSGPGTMAFGAHGRAHAGRFSAPGTYLVRVTVSDGQFTASDQINVTVGGTTNLVPADWISSDIGPTTLRGFSGTVRQQLGHFRRRHRLHRATPTAPTPSPGR